MKKLLLLLFALPFLANSQDDNSALPVTGPGQYRWEIGINGGVNITDLSGVDSIQTDNRVGRLYGITLVYHATRHIAIKTDIDFENKGWTYKNVETSTQAPAGVDVNQYLDYFDIPMFLHIGFGNRLKFDLDFGAYVAFLTQAKAFYEDPSTGEEVVLDEEQFTGYSDFDWGLTYGAGLDFALNPRISLGFDLLYEQGLQAIKGDDLKNTSLDFDFGITFNFGEKKR